MVKRGLTLPFLLAAGCLLQAGDWDVYLRVKTLSPRSDNREGTTDALSGQRLGKTVLRGGDLRQMGVGTTFTLLSPGDWRIRGGLEATQGLGDVPLNFRYLRFQGFTEFSATTDGNVKTSTLTPSLSLVYVSAGAGEYGISYGHHLTKLDYEISRNVIVNNGVTTVVAPSTLSTKFGDPFVSLHATFVQRYRVVGFFARLGYGVNLTSGRTLHEVTEADFLGTREALLDLARPKQELTLDLGIRF